MSICLTKSGYCNYIQCEKIFWMDIFKRDCGADGKDENVLETGRQVGELAKGLFGDYEDIPFDCDFDARLEKTEELLNDKGNVITEAAFIYKNTLCSVDILKNDSDGVEIYEVKSSTEVKDIYVDDVAFQYFVLSGFGLNVKRAAVVYINKEYVRGSELEMDELFNIEDITDIVLDKQDEIRANIDTIFSYLARHGKDDEPLKDIGKFCFDPYSCPFWQYCTRDLPTPNVFDIAGMQKRSKFKKYYEGKISFEDLKNEKINAKYLEQIDFELNDREPKINRRAIADFLSNLRYPLYFIDYESCRYAIPELEGTKPYQQIPFQYSLHIIREEGAPVEHREFLADADDKNVIRNFAESMIRDMPENGSVIVYNKTFEATRNKEIGEMFPDLKEEMDRFNNNMADLMVPFRKRDYYTREMKGSYSIKYVLPALYPDDPELNYGNLSMIHKGDEASNAFLTLKEKSFEEQKEIRKALLEYCKLDTYAMVKIWERFIEVTE